MINSNLDERKLKRLKVRIIELEKDNLIRKTKKRDEMVEEVRKIIEYTPSLFLYNRILLLRLT